MSVPLQTYFPQIGTHRPKEEVVNQVFFNFCRRNFEQRISRADHPVALIEVKIFHLCFFHCLCIDLSRKMSVKIYNNILYLILMFIVAKL